MSSENEKAEKSSGEPEKGRIGPSLIQAALVLLAVGLIVWALLGGRAPLEVGNPAPELLLTSYDKRGWSLEKFEGKPIVVNFWGTWCPPCLQELPDFAETARKHPEVVFIGAAVQSPAAEVAKLARRMDIPYLLAEVSERGVRDWNARSLPSTYILDKDHKIVYAMTGPMRSHDLERVFKEKLR